MVYKLIINYMKTTLIVLGVLLVVAVVGLSFYDGAESRFIKNTWSGNKVNSVGYLTMNSEITNLPNQEISADEKVGLLYMREEEKLARDVYTTLYKKWGMQIFSNISQSEQTHTDAVKALLVKYNITDPVVDDTVGVFVNSDLKNLYTSLVNKGLTSREDALTVGATIEDLDISDLDKYVAKTDNQDIKMVYENLNRGSRNHLRAFASQLSSLGVVYEPKYISKQDYNQIILSDTETGGMMYGNGAMRGGRGYGGR